MKYLLMIYDIEEYWDTLSEGEQKAIIDGHVAMQQAARADGAMRGGARLTPTSAATTVRTGPQGQVVLDGPFAETKEHLGGYYVMECADLDQALRYAKMIPMGGPGCVEVRPIVYEPNVD